MTAESTGNGTALVERDHAMTVAGASLQAALAGQPRLVLIGGEPGIGKTAMAREVSRRAQERGAQLGWGAGWEGAGAQPYWPWSRALRRGISSVGHRDGCPGSPAGITTG
jgi:predicted ATPase